MTYHNNKITFKVKHPEDKYTVGACYFKIDALSVTDGQDPKRKVQVGQSRAWSGPKEGSFSFELGRKNNEEPAKFWKGNFTEDQSTFDHYPDELNFAFYGPLEIEVTGGPNGKSFYTIWKFGIGQGHAGESNNWWVASSTTYRKSGFQISCEGEGTFGDKLYFTFRRGNNAVDVVDITSISPFQT
jgi:hypothetical protein